VKITSLYGIMLLGALLVGCNNSTETSKKEETIAKKVELSEIEGEVWYRERILLPEHTQLLLTLEDVSKQDVAATIIADTQMTVGTAPPWRFKLAYDASKIQDNHRYAVRARVEVDGKLKFINTSHIPAFEGSDGKGVSILVSAVGQNQQASLTSKPNSSLENTYWKLVRLNDEPVVTPKGRKEMSMTFRGGENSVSGYSGCNSFSGGYEHSEDKLEFKPLMATQMACLDIDHLEMPFLQALGKTKRFEIVGEMLALKDGEGNVLMHFKAVYL